MMTMSASCEDRARRLGCGILAIAIGLVPGPSLAQVAPAGEPRDHTPTPESEQPAQLADDAEPAEDEGDHADQADDQRDEALAAFRAATRSYELGRYEEAIAGFEQAWELMEAPQLLYNIGQAYWRRFEVDPDVDHLRRARTFFRNYDKRMQGTDFYDPTDIERTIEQIEQQIEEREALEAERSRPVVQGPSLAEQEAQLRRQLERERQYRVTRAFNASGVAFIVLGAASLVMGVAAVTTRVTTGAVLDNATGGGRGVNLASAEQDARRRRQYLVAGRVAFAGFVAGGITLPIGITLRIVGRARVRRGLGDPLHESSSDARRTDEGPRSSVAIEPSGGLLTVRF